MAVAVKTIKVKDMASFFIVFFRQVRRQIAGFLVHVRLNQPSFR